jgi:hypothetical protein
MVDDVRQDSDLSSTSSSNITTREGMFGDAEQACGCPQPGPETIQVEQVLGAEMSQKVVEFDMFVPDPKPDIEQVVDVYVKDIDIISVDVIHNKVIIRGDLEVKVMYVADLPNNPVHAFEKSPVRFTRDIVIEGAEPGMEARADVEVEYIDYDFCCDHNRKVHITIVLKFRASVVATTEMDIIALNPLEQLEQMEATNANISANGMYYGEQAGGEFASAGQYTNYGAENVYVSGPGVEPTTGSQTAMSGSGSITGSNVNVRTGPGTSFPVVTKVNKGDVVTIREQAFGWYKVVLPDGATTGWIASWLVDTGVPGQPKG